MAGALLPPDWWADATPFGPTRAHGLDVVILCLFSVAAMVASLVDSPAARAFAGLAAPAVATFAFGLRRYVSPGLVGIVVPSCAVMMIGAGLVALSWIVSAIGRRQARGGEPPVSSKMR